MSNPLSDEEKAQIEELRSQGLGYIRIGRIINRPRSTVRSYLTHEFGPRPKACVNWAERDAELRQKIAEGKSFSAIGREMGLSKGTVIGRAHRIGAKSLFQQGQRSDLAGPKRYRKGLRQQRGQGGLSVVGVGEVPLPTLPSLTEPTTPLPEPIPAPRTVMRSHKPGEGCRYPLWGDEWPTHRYCDEARIPGKSWCQFHYDRVFTKQSWRDAA